MPDFAHFSNHFFHALGKVWRIFLGLLTLLLLIAVAIAYFENIPFDDALYFTFITGLTIGYGDIAPETNGGRILSILTGLLGVLFTGLVVAVAVYAVKETLGENEK